MKKIIGWIILALLGIGLLYMLHQGGNSWKEIFLGIIAGLGICGLLFLGIWLIID